MGLTLNVVGRRGGDRLAIETLEQRTVCAVVLGVANDTGANRRDRLTSDPTLTISPAITGGQRVEYFVDSGPIREATVGGGRSFVPEGVETDGRHRIYARVVAADGRPQRWCPAFFYTLDRAASPVNVRLSADTGVSATDGVSSSEKLTVTGREPGSTIQYSRDDGTWTPETAAWGAYAPRPGPNRWLVRQIDAAGNASAPSAVSFDWDTNRDVALRLEGPQSPTFTAVTGAEATWVIEFAAAMHVQPVNRTLPQLRFTFRGMTLYAQYQSGSGTNRLTYSHVFTADEAGTGDLAAPTSACLCYGGSITDAAGNRMRKHPLPPPVT